MRPRVCFITPPSLFLMDERVFIALGILKVAAVAEQLGYPVEHLDLNGVENYLDVVSDYVSHTSARIFALTATTPQMPAVERIAVRIRSLRPTAKLILGGPHPTLLYNTQNGAPSADDKHGLMLEGRFYRSNTSWTNGYWWDGKRRRKFDSPISNSP